MADIIFNDLFGYEGLKVAQRKDMLNFSLDSVLLAHFVTIPKKSVLIGDIGTGNGAVALILTKRTNAKIIGFEIQPDVADLAQISVDANKLGAQVHIETCDVVDAPKHYSNTFDVIVSNPPFFKLHPESNVNNSDYKTLARHELSLTLEQLIKSTKKLLKTHGYFALVHRPDRIQEIITMLTTENFAIKRIQFIHPKSGKNAKSVLVEAIKGGNESGTFIHPPIIAHDETGDYSAEIREMFVYGKGKED